MQRKMERALVVALFLVGFTRLMTAQVPLDEQLKAQFNLVKMGEDSNGAAVIEAGTILNVKKGGILSVPYSDQSGALPPNIRMASCTRPMHWG